VAKLIGNVASFDVAEVAHPAHEFLAIWIVIQGSGSDVSDAGSLPRLLRLRRERPRRSRTAEQGDEIAALCMSGKQHSERRRGFGHDRLPVATGSPQALRISNRE
jgi:hypothetical protein